MLAHRVRAIENIGLTNDTPIRLVRKVLKLVAIDSRSH